MKTIFVPIFFGHLARNFFRTGIYETLARREGVRLVIFVPPYKKKYYEKEFGRMNVVFESLDVPNEFPFLEKIIVSVGFCLVDSDTIFVRHKREYAKTENMFKYYGKRVLTRTLGHLPFLKRIVRFIDYTFLPDRVYKKYFDTYKPDLIFSMHVFGKMDLLLLKQAKKKSVRSLGMVNSWDNVSSRGFMRSMPDKLIVHNEIIKDHAVKYAAYNEHNIFVSGMPHFDYYYNYVAKSREAFAEKLGANPTKKFILFCPAGSRLNDTDWQVASMIDEAIQKKEIFIPSQMIVRFPPNADMDMGSFSPSKDVILEKPGRGMFQDATNDWEFTKEDMNHLADSLTHADVVVNYASTITLDAFAFDTPVITVIFDGWEKKRSGLSIDWIVQSTHYKNVVKHDAVPLPKSRGELVDAINLYLSDRSHDSEARKKVLLEQCLYVDGKNSERIGKFVLSELFSIV